MPKRILLVFLVLLSLAPSALSEIILWEDENGKVIMDDEGGIDFLPPGENAPAMQEEERLIEETFTPVPVSTPSPEDVQRLTHTYGLHTPLPTALPIIESALQYGDSGDHVLAAQQRLTDLGYYHGKCSGDYLEGTQSAVRRFQKINGFKETGKLDVPTWVVLFSAAATARDGSHPYATPSPIPEATPTPTPEPFVYSRILRYGDSGDSVARLQSRLAELGFYEARISGGYYKITQSAVRAFQNHNGLSADGVAGRQTQELLFSADALPVSAAPRPSPTPVPTTYTLMVDVANQIVRAYTYDESGAYTVLVREMICSTGTKKNPTPLGTTIMPSKRARWGYFPTWDSHAQYLTRIDSANAFHSVLYSAADESTLAVSSFDALGTPASHGCVRLYVSDAKWIYDNCKAGTIITVYEGEYDPEYTMTLRRTLNPDTLRENPLPRPTSSPVYARENWPAQYRTLYKGREGADVYMVQMRLAELGYYTGSITGGYYGGTIEAVKAFQRDYGLTVDGAAGEKTLSVLFSSAYDPAPQDTPSPAPTASPSPQASASPLPTPSPSPAPNSVPTADPSLFVPILDSVG